VDTEALIELLNGVMPAARVPRTSPVCVPSGTAKAAPEPARLGGYEMPALRVERLRAALAEARRPAALLRVRDANYGRARTVASLRQYVPAGLVGDVRVDGRNWDKE